MKKVDPFKPGRRMAQSLVRIIKMGREHEMDVDSSAELTNQTSYLTPYIKRYTKYLTTKVSTKNQPVRKLRDDSGESEKYTEEISSFSEEEDNKAIGPVDKYGEHEAGMGCRSVGPRPGKPRWI